MSLSTLHNAGRLPAEARNIASCMLFSLLGAELTLFFTAETRLSLIDAAVWLMAFFCNYQLTKRGMMSPLPTLRRLCYGFVATAGGLILIRFATHHYLQEYGQLVGMVCVGAGQGVASRAVQCQWQGERPGRLLRLVIVLFVILSSLLILNVSALPGVNPAVALLVDLALLGALYCKIVQQAP